VIFCPVLGVSCIRACRGQAGGSVTPLWGCRGVLRGAVRCPAVKCWVNDRLHHQREWQCSVRDCDLLRLASTQQSSLYPFLARPPCPHSTVSLHRGPRGRLMHG